MKTVIVTGAAGLLGAHFSRHLLEKGYRVLGIDDLSGGYYDYLPKHPMFEFWQIDLSDCEPLQLEHIFTDPRRDIVACYHFAAYAAEGLSPFIRTYNYTNNVLSYTNIVNPCIEHDVKLIFTSSMAVYGDQEAPFTEDMQPAPVDPYGVAKFAVEQDLAIAADQHGLRYTIVRPHNIIGTYQNIWDRYRNVAGIFIRKVLDGEPMLVYGDGEQTRAFSDVKYYMEPFEAMIHGHDGEIFNLGADKAYTINELAEVVGQAAWKRNYTPKIDHVEARHEVKHAYCDHAKAKNLLNFSDDTNLEDLISEMFDWATQQPKREQKTMAYEVEKGIYDYWK